MCEVGEEKWCWSSGERWWSTGERWEIDKSRSEDRRGGKGRNMRRTKRGESRRVRRQEQEAGTDPNTSAKQERHRQMGSLIDIKIHR